MKQTKQRGWLKDFILPVAIGLVVAFGFKTWVASAAEVPSSSMYPTIPGVSYTHFALITVNKLAIEFGQIHRGEVVLFHFPDDPSEIYVKRIIGMPGDTVKVTANAVYIDGKRLDESNVNIARYNGTATGTFHVPAGHYFMLGDNRPISEDSRLWTHKYVARSAIVGEANAVFFPFNKAGAISQSVTSPTK